MNKTIIKCVTTAPMFMAGANQDKPELRASSIKGNMRFIWRALQRASNIEELRSMEGRIFGNAFGGEKTKASEMRISIRNASAEISKEVMVPHRELREYVGKGRSFSTAALKTGSTFDVSITSFVDEKAHTDYIRLFSLTCLLYGFGRRSRKGFGTIKIISIAGVGSEVDFSLCGAVDNLNTLSQFDAKYSLENDNEITANGGNPAEYPCIEKIKLLGASTFEDTIRIIEQIGMEVHNYNHAKFLGAAKPRFASSILLTTVPWDDKSYRCIVTQLKCTKSFEQVDRDNFYTFLDGRV